MNQKMEKKKIPFNKPAFVGKELEYIKDAIDQGMLCGDGQYTKTVLPG